jgi:predicted RNase H-like HicB family nuclease
MRFVIAIEPGDEKHAFGVVVPDLPGCFSAGDTLDEAFENAKEAIDLWCETVIQDGWFRPATLWRIISPILNFWAGCGR